MTLHAIRAEALRRLSGPPPAALAGRLGRTAPSIEPAAGGVEGAADKRHALVVEDEFLTSWHLSDMMSQLGFQVVGVSATGEDAIRLAAETEPDVILMDVSLKGSLDGIEAAQTILAKRPVSIVFVTAYTDDATMKRMEAVDGTLRIAKPVTAIGLRDALGTIFDDD